MCLWERGLSARSGDLARKMEKMEERKMEERKMEEENGGEEGMPPCTSLLEGCCKVYGLSSLFF